MSTLANAMDVLKLITRLRRDITVTDVSTELKLPKSSASRTLSMMATYGFLERDAVTRAYRPGSVIMEASYHFRASRNTTSMVEEALHALVGETGFTGYINVLDGADSLVIHMRVGTGSLQIYTPAGTRAPAYATAPGRALLAGLSDAEVVQLTGGRLELRRGNAPRTRKDLLARLTQVRTQGWSLSRDEYVSNVAGVAAAVMDPASRQRYGFGIALPVELATDSASAKLGLLVRDAARTIGKSVGDPYWLAFQESAG